jgi:type I restriction enzyme S subunit
MKDKSPQLRFPEFNTDLMSSDLSDLANNIASGSIKSKDKGEYDVHGSTGIIGKSDEFSHQGTYLLIARVGANAGTLNKVSGKFAVTDNTLVVDVNDQINITFLFNYLENYDLNRHIFGSGQPLITGTILKNLTIVYPHLEEQEKIANFLSSADQKIQQLRRKKELQEEYKKGVMQKLFSQEIRFKDENGEDFPDWEFTKLGDLTKKTGKKNKENKPYPVYSINNEEGFLPQEEQFDDLNSVDRGYDITNYRIIYPKTFAYNPARINVGSIGYSYDLHEVIVSSLYVCFKTNKRLKDEYLLHYLDTYEFRNSVLRYQEGGVRQYLFYGNFSAIKIPLPKPAEQVRISNYLTALNEKISKLDSQIGLAEKIKKGLLQQMFV